MKRATALKHAEEISRRIRSVNGILATPNCTFPALRIRRAWVFGSTVKGSDAPNDLDILLDITVAGKYRRWKRGMKLNKRYARSYGVLLCPDSETYALMWLTNGMKKVSRHVLQSEPRLLEMIGNDKRMIYPKKEQI